MNFFIKKFIDEDNNSADIIIIYNDKVETDEIKKDIFEKNMNNRFKI